MPGTSKLLALIYKKQRKWDQALAQYELALKEKPRAPEIHYGMAVIYWQTGKHDLADEHFKEAYNLDPVSSKVVISFVEHLREQRKFREALSYLDSSLLAAPTNDPVKITRVQTLLDLGEFDTARQSVEADVAANPNGLEPILGMAMVKANQGDVPAAIQWLEKYELQTSRMVVLRLLTTTSAFDSVRTNQQFQAYRARLALVR